MQYRITHTTTYKYSQPVELSSHIVRLRPRCDVAQKLLSFDVEITPTPVGAYKSVEIDGNANYKYQFEGKTELLRFQVTSGVETQRSNPFNFMLDAYAVELPIDYPSSILNALQPYLWRHGVSTSIDAIATQLAQEIYLASNANVVTFLSELNVKINSSCEYVIRETGSPLPAGVTWSQKVGSCRDFAVLFIECCRAVGLAARFVSGYHEGDPDEPEQHLHAWAEVYLPGAGWRGYDPTLGISVADQHIALVASATPALAAPITGRLKTPNVQSQMHYDLTIERIEQIQQSQSGMQQQLPGMQQQFGSQQQQQ
ncbi:transglutaminase domain-containing protein [Thalassoporum mexicanum PCC 7367]|uniref:transglutaminase family protein n=1 Tax=Thalassoporum mexicanum TaxID=3457544 RepID=UPI00029FF231|nr:transglutaminase family protein [Pseudanabaena sp. PCC 7367]AFY70154.1 transglutaminase domain-containing protein [Pseudanabaena sp. PCC 7367]